MFGIPIDSLTLESIEEFLKSGVREGVALDFKEDFPAKLAKTISSFANTYGGIVLVGVEETSTGAGVLPIKGVSLKSGLREQVIQTCLDAIYPPLIPEVRVVPFKSNPSLGEDDRAVVVIRVEESEIGSHAIDQRTTVYLRVDNVSDPFRKATVEDLEWFAQKRSKSLAEKMRILDLVRRHAQQYLIMLRHRNQMSTSDPSGRFVCWTVPTFPRLPLADTKRILEVGKQLALKTYLPGIGFPFGTPTPVAEGVLWHDLWNRNLRYTEVQQQGMIYSEFGFWSESNAVSCVAAAMLIGAALKYAMQLYEALGYFGLFDFEFRLMGVKDRIVEAKYVHDTPYPMIDDVVELHSRQRVTANPEELREQAFQMLRQIYWAFGLDVSPKRLEEDFTFAGLGNDCDWVIEQN
jgi:hypothetical protein